MSIEYAPLDLSEIGVEAERVSREPGAGSFLENFVRLPKGDGYLLMRFLPRLSGKKLYCATRTHKLADKTYHCPRVLTMTPNGPFWVAPDEGEDCPVCKYYKAQWQKSLKVTDEKVREAIQNACRIIKPVERYYYNVVVREYVNPKTNKLEKNVGPLIFSCGKTVHAMIMTAIVGDVKAGKKRKGDITDPKEGRDFRLVKKTVRGAGGFEYPGYEGSEFEEPSPAGTQEELEKWLENLHDLTTLRKVKDFATLDRALKVHNGVLEPDDEEFDTSVYERGGDPDSDDDGTGGAPVPATRKPQGPGGGAEKPIAKQEKKDSSKAKAAEEEIMADPEFMAELDALETEK